MLRDIILALLILVAAQYIYEKGVDDGYYMHEAEENLYSCPIAPEEDWI